MYDLFKVEYREREMRKKGYWKTERMEEIGKKKQIVLQDILLNWEETYPLLY